MVSVPSGPAHPLAWISISKPMYITDGYQDSVKLRHRCYLLQDKKEFIERLKMFVMISFAGFDPSSSISKCRRGAFFDFFFFLIRIIHITIHSFKVYN